MKNIITEIDFWWWFNGDDALWHVLYSVKVECATTGESEGLCWLAQLYIQYPLNHHSSVINPG
jgi:hypothetical protein